MKSKARDEANGTSISSNIDVYTHTGWACTPVSTTQQSNHVIVWEKKRKTMTQDAFVLATKNGKNVFF